MELPTHIGIIMDGNGRWAVERHLPRIAGHKEGINSIKEIADVANELGIKVLTLYAFSTENWKRPHDEVSFLMNLPIIFLKKELNNLKRKNIKIQCTGFLEGVPGNTRNVLEKAAEETKNNTGLVLNFAFNYGGRAEILEAVKTITKEHAEGKIDMEQLDEELFETYLMTKNLPNVDLLIRTSGEVRISNFLLWQIAYAEMVFVDTYFPDFKKEEFLQAVEIYQNRTRRFGALK